MGEVQRKLLELAEWHNSVRASVWAASHCRLKPQKVRTEARMQHKETRPIRSVHVRREEKPSLADDVLPILYPFL